MKITRRTFALSMGAATLLRTLHAQPAQQITLRLADGKPGKTLPGDFVGVSYELAELTEPTFFAPGHADLVGLFHRLSPSGLLRIGGNTSEFCWFRDTPGREPIALRPPKGGVEQNWMPHRLFAIEPAAIDNLSGFLRATGWKAIYGLNFGNSSPERAAREALYVHRALGDRLAFFQIGNEPDFYRDSNNGTRPAGWGFDDYVREWVAYADAITAAIPGARFGGPDTGASSNWVVRFGDEIAPKLGDGLVALSGHYYAEGPPDDPRTTTERLLAGNPKVATSTGSVVAVADRHNLLYHMAEGNSCFRGGKPGMSNAFASSLWAADYMLLLGSLGCGGVNLHGGSSRFLSAGLGDHNPGLKAAGAAPTSTRNGFYTPISAEPGEPAEARPVFYGMLFAGQFAGATMLDLPGLPQAGVNVYAATRNGRHLVAIINKTPAAAGVTLRDLRGRAELLSLTAPTLESTQEVRLGGAAIGVRGEWKPVRKYVSSGKGGLSLRIPPGSALLVTAG